MCIPPWPQRPGTTPDELDLRYMSAKQSIAKPAEGQIKAMAASMEREVVGTGVHQIDLGNWVEGRSDVCEFKVPAKHGDQRLHGPLVTTTEPALPPKGLGVPKGLETRAGDAETRERTGGVGHEQPTPLLGFAKGEDLRTVPED